MCSNQIGFQVCYSFFPDVVVSSYEPTRPCCHCIIATMVARITCFTRLPQPKTRHKLHRIFYSTSQAGVFDVQFCFCNWYRFVVTVSSGNTTYITVSSTWYTEITEWQNRPCRQPNNQLKHRESVLHSRSSYGTSPEIQTLLLRLLLTRPVLF